MRSIDLGNNHRDHEMKLRWMGKAPYWRCKCMFETADLTKVARHVVTNQFEVKP